MPDPWHLHILPGQYNDDPTKPEIDREVWPITMREAMIIEGTDASMCFLDGQFYSGQDKPLVFGQLISNIELRNLTIRNMDAEQINGAGGQFLGCHLTVYGCNFLCPIKAYTVVVCSSMERRQRACL